MYVSGRAALLMKSIVDIVGKEEDRVEECVASPQKISDPVVYQLVRVDGNGRLVPATDDEVMAVEDLLEDDKSTGRVIQETELTLQDNTDYGDGPCCSSNVQVKASEGVPQLEVLEVGADKPNVPADRSMDSEGIDVQDKEAVPSLVRSASYVSVQQSGSLDGCPKLSGGFEESKNSNSAIVSSLKPDFSLLKGEIRLDNLSVKDLQETFKATFGRETYVKDKQWLKRRIIMGLTNSCDFSTTTLEIIDNRVVKKGKEETCNSADSTDLVGCVVTSARDKLESPSTCNDKKNDIHGNANETNIENSTIEDKFGSKDADTEQRPAKRVRKPTRRYIEELEEEDVEPGDSGAKFVSSATNTAYDQPSAKVYARHGQSIGVHGRCLTRNDSLGGSGVQVPYVSRIRRSRPRENFMTLMKLQPSGMGMPTRLEKNNVASNEHLDNESNNRVFFSPRWTQDSPGAFNKMCKPYTERKTIQMEKEVKMKNTESYKNNSSDDEVVTVPTSNGGMRRKHHRPWTLSEVVKLVEGVAKYGAGRWSEIKRLAFASYSYRTSVDLKDKWRNLLRASVAESPTGNRMNSSRKQASVPIPAPILFRVRELADIQTRVPPCLSSSRLAGQMDSNITKVHETSTRSGFL